jgi:hypothetical protein
METHRLHRSYWIYHTDTWDLPLSARQAKDTTRLAANRYKNQTSCSSQSTKPQYRLCIYCLLKFGSHDTDDGVSSCAECKQNTCIQGDCHRYNMTPKCTQGVGGCVNLLSTVRSQKDTPWMVRMRVLIVVKIMFSVNKVTRLHVSNATEKSFSQSIYAKM